MTDGQRAARVLVPLDGSDLAEQAIPYARALAGADGEIIFLQVIADPEPARSLLGRIEEPASEVLETEEEYALAWLRESATRWATVLGQEPRLVTAPGDPAEVILAKAREFACDYLVIASHGRGAVARLAFGSVADRITRAAALPTLIVRPDDAHREIGPVVIRRLLVPTDGSPLAEEALPVAAALAAHLQTPVHLIEAINPSALTLPSPAGSGMYAGEIYTEIEGELTEAAKANLARAVEQLAPSGAPVTSAVVVGPPVSAIEEAVEEGDIIVMASHGRSGVRRWLLGSTSEKLIRTGPAPVMLVPSSARTTA